VTQRILLVEDDEALGRQVVSHLRGAGFSADWIRDGDRALAADPSPYALAILDLMLPGAYGLDVLKRLRTRSDLPVLILSARNDGADKVRSLRLGADDYMTKPFWPEELVARVQARLRRPEMRRDGVVETGGLAVDLEGRRVTVEGKEVSLTRAEFDLLAALARRPGAAVSRAVLLESVLDPDREATERTLDVHFSRIRKKLGSAGRRVATVWGVGYRLEQGGGR
jgi:DNA-binding response OmpR family regulator